MEDPQQCKHFMAWTACADCRRGRFQVAHPPEKLKLRDDAMPSPAEWEQMVLEAFGFTRDELGRLREKAPFSDWPVDTSYGLMQVIEPAPRSWVPPESGPDVTAAWDYMADLAGLADRRSRWMTSQYDGSCTSCGERWRAGEEQVRYDPDAGGMVCSACGSGELE
jgi:hypothetical protein